MTDPTPLPSTHRALILTSTTVDPEVTTTPLPPVLPGTVLLRIISTPIISYTKEIFLGNERNYPYPLPIVPGTSAVARVAAASSDTPSLTPGQLVLFDCFVRGRPLDASGGQDRYLSSIHDGFTPGSKQLMQQPGFRDGSYAEYTLVPAENCYVLDESRLLGEGLGYSPADLCAVATVLIPYGGLRSVDVRPGETVLVSPATGQFGGAACLTALAMGARVVAWGRNAGRLAALKTKLESLAAGRYKGMVDVVPMTADADADLAALKSATGGRGFDVFFDISPPAAEGSHHLKTGILALRFAGRVSFMGGIRGDVPIPNNFVMHFDITVKGKWMYERRDVVEVVRMAETGVLPLGERGGWDVAGRFPLDRWREAWDLAYEKTEVGQMVVIEP